MYYEKLKQQFCAMSSMRLCQVNLARQQTGTFPANKLSYLCVAEHLRLYNVQILKIAPAALVNDGIKFDNLLVISSKMQPYLQYG